MRKRRFWSWVARGISSTKLYFVRNQANLYKTTDFADESTIAVAEQWNITAKNWRLCGMWIRIVWQKFLKTFEEPTASTFKVEV
jgi:hypothetical protein